MYFGKYFFNYYRFIDVDVEVEIVGMFDILEGLNECVVVGKICYCGLFDDMIWGIVIYLKLS